MAYTKTTWVDGTTPLNATNFNKMENGIDAVTTSAAGIDTRVAALEAAPVGDLSSLTSDVSNLKTQSTDYDTRLDALEALNISATLTSLATRLTTAEGNITSMNTTLTTVHSDLVGHTHDNLAGDVTGAANLPSQP